MLNVENADVYTDFSGLSRLKADARSKRPEAIKEVAKQFESVFLSMVLKSMRQAKLSEGILDSDQSEFYRDMYDQQLAVHLSGEPGIGLAELIAKQLSPKENRYQEKLGVEEYFNRSVAVAAKPLEKKSHHSSFVKTPTQVSRYDHINIPVSPISSQDQFVKQLLPYAEQAASKLNVDAAVLLAQAALETGWGKSVIKHADGSSSFNLFNIKAGRAWQGDRVGKMTLEFSEGIGRKEMAAFRSYDSYQDSFKDYVHFIKSNPRYKNAVKVAKNPERYLLELQKAGYATDPEYASKVMRIFRGETLKPNPAVVALK